MKTNNYTKLDACLATMPVVAIIRGVKTDEVVDVGSAIQAAGIQIIEVPLNSPNPFESIERLSTALGDRCVTGCGTLVNADDAQRVADAGGQIAVTPNTNVDVIHASLRSGLIPMPGWATPTEAYTAYQAGAQYLKLFPAASYGPKHIGAVRAVLPNDVKVLAVGGVGADNAAEWLRAGIDGFGIGSEIYRPGDSADDVFQKASRVVAAIRAAQHND